MRVRPMGRNRAPKSARAWRPAHPGPRSRWRPRGARGRSGAQAVLGFGYTSLFHMARIALLADVRQRPAGIRRLRVHDTRRSACGVLTAGRMPCAQRARSRQTLRDRDTTRQNAQHLKGSQDGGFCQPWIPAFAGMTRKIRPRHHHRLQSPARAPPLLQSGRFHATFPQSAPRRDLWRAKEGGHRPLARASDEPAHRAGTNGRGPTTAGRRRSPCAIASAVPGASSSRCT